MIHALLDEGIARTMFLKSSNDALALVEKIYSYHIESIFRRRDGVLVLIFPMNVLSQPKGYLYPMGIQKWKRKEFHINFCKAKNKDGLYLQCDHNFHFK